MLSRIGSVNHNFVLVSTAARMWLPSVDGSPYDRPSALLQDSNGDVKAHADLNRNTPTGLNHVGNTSQESQLSITKCRAISAPLKVGRTCFGIQWSRQTRAPSPGSPGDAR